MPIKVEEITVILAPVYENYRRDCQKILAIMEGRVSVEEIYIPLIDNCSTFVIIKNKARFNQRMYIIPHQFIIDPLLRLGSNDAKLRLRKIITDMMDFDWGKISKLDVFKAVRVKI